MEDKTELIILVKIIYWENETAVELACSILNNGGVIVYPTDTLYGFGCDAKNESAIEKINALKGRKAPMSVLAPNRKIAAKWMNISQNDKNIVLKKLGGSTTIIVPVKGGITSPSITGDKQTLGVRIPDHNFCQKLSEAYPNPITTTSVNRTRQEPLTNPEKILSEFSREIDLIIEDGIIEGSGSIIYNFQNRELNIIRL
jgi:tRNA threonylcarbamoyl adenosine modification protein (Sua5/YciO/YrdC/YwlC family)|tara:strand:+ start:187 stop:786 length:600 start_codon:yes stop_codon:yes gene_type:complete